MKRSASFFLALTILAAWSLPSLAQEEKEKDKKKEVEQIIITRKGGDNHEKIVVEINGDNVTVNGKPLDDYKEGDLKVRRNKFKSYESMGALTMPRSGNWNFDWNDDDGIGFFNDEHENRAMLGVTTEKTEQGAKVADVTEGSAAEKAGIKKGDIITKIGDTKIEDPDDLSNAIRKQKPGDKITITLIRDKKEQKITAELGKWKGIGALAFSPKMPDMRILEQTLPRIQQLYPRNIPFGQDRAWSGGSPRLGISVQDREDGKGVNVIDVDEEGNASKAGIKENDIITHINDKEVNSADEVAKLIKENKDSNSIQLKIKREGKTQTIEVKMPKKLKTADL